MSSKTNQTETDSSQNILDYLFMPQHTVVYGPMGRGKTNTVAHLANRFAKFWDATILTPLETMTEANHAVYIPSYTDLTDWVRDHPDEVFIFAYPECTDLISSGNRIGEVFEFVDDNGGMVIADCLHFPSNYGGYFDMFVKMDSKGEGIIHGASQPPEHGSTVTIPYSDLEYDTMEPVEFNIYRR